MGMERYKRFLIDGSAIPTFATEHDWCSQGTIFRASRRLDSIVGSNASEGRSSAAEKRQKSTVSSCAKIGLINSLDCPPVTCRGPLLGTYYGFLNGTPDNVIIVDGRFGQKWAFVRRPRPNRVFS